MAGQSLEPRCSEKQPVQRWNSWATSFDNERETKVGRMVTYRPPWNELYKST